MASSWLGPFRPSLFHGPPVHEIKSRHMLTLTLQAGEGSTLMRRGLSERKK
jgi:hypothetical protein